MIVRILKNLGREFWINDCVIFAGLMIVWVLASLNNGATITDFLYATALFFILQPLLITSLFLRRKLNGMTLKKKK